MGKAPQAAESAADIPFLPFAEAIRQVGISRTVGYELLNKGMFETFKIGGRRYIMLASLRSLPERLARKERVA